VRRRAAIRAAGTIVAAGVTAAAAAGCGDGRSRAGEPVTVFAASSLGPAMEEIAGLHRIRAGEDVVVELASSSALAARVDAGEEADVLVAASRDWLDRLVGRGRIRAGSVFDAAGNALVIVAPAGAAFSFAVGDSGGLPGAFEGRLAVGDPEGAPFGGYARQSLERAGWWKALEARLVAAADAEAALGLVERGECAAGIVFASDALGSERVHVVERIPDDWHEDIVYAAGLVEGRALPGAERFLETLKSPEAAKILRKYGFRVPERVAP
jgi:molybdate transport system substrate-binding protein